MKQQWSLSRMATSQMTGLYQPLLGGRGIRLLVLADDLIRPGQALRCKLEEQDLDRVLPWDSYSALSYVWGSSTERVEISCNDCSAFITTNLYHALVQIWSMTPQKRLWADALCINQEDDVEKGFQVGLMGDTYRQAGAVIIWFGETNKQTLSLWNSVQANESYDTDDLGHFLQNAWFYRAWTLQEVLLAPKAVALCGPKWIDWNRFKNRVPVSGPMKQLQDCTQIMQNQKLELDGRSPLSSMMLATLNRDAQDTRDKVYALLALFSDNRLDISPNYEITAIELYKRIFIANYNTYGDLIFLHGSGSGWTEGFAEKKRVQYLEEDGMIGNTINSQNETLPSWTLDLGDVSRFEQIKQRKVFPLIAGAIPFPRQALDAKPGLLRLAGVPIGILEFKHNIYPEVCHLRMLPRCIYDDPTLLECSCIARVDFYERSAIVKLITLNPNYPVQTVLAELPPASKLHFLTDLHRTGRCSWTRRGLHQHQWEEHESRLHLPCTYFLPEAQTGDMVCVLSGGDGCFLLRPTSTTSFRLVGSAFRSASSLGQLEVDVGEFFPIYYKTNIAATKDYSSGIFQFDII